MDIVKEYPADEKAPVILVVSNGKLKELHKKVNRDWHLRFVTTRENIGNHAYRRSACMIFLKAVYDVAGKNNIDKGSASLFHWSRLLFYHFRQAAGGSAVSWIR